MSRRPQTPRLFPGTATSFASQGLGALTDAVSIQITEELNGGMELTMVYPVEGVHFGDIVSRSLILAKPNPVADAYPFRVYSITKPLNGRCTIRAHGWHYDLSGIPVAPFTSANPSAVMDYFNNSAAVPHPFVFSTDLATSADFSLGVPASIFSVMGGVEGSVIDTFPGEWVYGYGNDPTAIRLASHRGQDRGVSVRYGKNLTALEQEENISSVYTGVFPFWADAEGNLVTLPEQILNADGSFSFVRILPLDLSAEFEEMPDEDSLRARATAYMNANQIGVPSVSLNVSMELLAMTDQYAGAALVEDVELGDTVTVSFEALGVNATARCIQMVYDALSGRLVSVRLGSAKANIADTISSQERAVTRMQTAVSTPIVSAINRATDRIVGNLGGCVVMRYNSEGQPYELLIMDDPDITVATKVWRWNSAGLGYSSTGYAGNYGLAMTADGEIVADFITAGHLNADRITMGASDGDELTDYFRVYMDANDRAVVELGANENNIVLKLQNDRVSFFDTQGTELAYFSDNSFQIVTLQSFVLQNLKIVVLDNGAYGFMAAN